MNRILISLAIALGSVVSIAPASNAATEGCPDTWKVDLSSISGYQELLEAKQRLGGDMVIDEGATLYSDYAGELGPLPKPRQRLDLSDSYLYGNTKVTTKYNVQVKNCPGVIAFTFNQGKLNNSRLLVLDVDSKKWSAENQSRFPDFVKAENFSQCLAANIKMLQTPGKFQVEFQSNRLKFISPLFRNCYGGEGIFEKTPSCRESTTGNPTQRISITLGTKCVYAYGVLNLDKPQIIIFENFTIDSNKWRTSITCVKGTSKKIVQGLKGYEFKMKCPSGYKKK